MKRAISLSVLVLGLWAEAASGQLFRSEDLQRPLVPEQLPRLEVYTATFTHLDEPGLRSHLRLLKNPWYVFSVQNRDQWGQGFDIAKLMKAVSSVEEDPYAWHLLGAYYALGHELAAATEANREALARIELLRHGRSREVADRFLGDLELRCRANLSRLLTSQDQPREALAVLGESFPKDANPIVRHALITAGVLAFLDAGEIAAADTLLAQGEGEQTVDGRETDAVSSQAERGYPQFGSRWREQTLPYLRARRLYTAELYSQAVEGLKRFDGPAAKAKFWEARFLLGLARWKAGELEAGIDVLERLEHDLPKTMRGRPKGKIQRPELLWYNVGLLHAQRNESSHLERDDYQTALELTIDRDCRIFKELLSVKSAAKCPLENVCASLKDQAGFLAEEFERKEIVPGCREVCDSIDQSSEPVNAPAEKILCQALAFEPFSAAFNNLGLYYLRRAREAKELPAKPDVETKLLNKAERALRAGLVGTDTTQHWRLRLNLVLVELERAAFDAAVIEGRRAIEESPARKAEMAELLSDALRRNESFRSTETALTFFLDLATQLAATDMPEYLTSVLTPMASGAPGWAHVSAAFRDRATALLRSPVIGSSG